jgi:hypothetical protein
MSMCLAAAVTAPMWSCWGSIGKLPSRRLPLAASCSSHMLLRGVQAPSASSCPWLPFTAGTAYQPGGCVYTSMLGAGTCTPGTKHCRTCRPAADRTGSGAVYC